MKEFTQLSSNRVNILGIDVECIEKEELLSLVCNWAKGNGTHFITYVNAHCLNVAKNLASYQKALKMANIIYSDGISVVWAGRFLHGCRLHKITGREWIYDFCHMAAYQKISIYILAGAPGVAKSASLALQSRFPGLKVAGTNDGYFLEKSENIVIEEILQSKPNVLFVGMGIPKQELWISSHMEELQVPVYWAVGALFDYVAGIEPPVPPWMNKLALEWLWRLMIDPTGKWKRYIFGNPYFIFRVIAQKINGSV